MDERTHPFIEIIVHGILSEKKILLSVMLMDISTVSWSFFFIDAIRLRTRPDQPVARPGARSECEAPVLHVHTFICLSIYLSFCPSVCLSVCLSIFYSHFALSQSFFRLFPIFPPFFARVHPKARGPSEREARGRGPMGPNGDPAQVEDRIGINLFFFFLKLSSFLSIGLAYEVYNSKST